MLPLTQRVGERARDMGDNHTERRADSEAVITRFRAGDVGCREGGVENADDEVCGDFEPDVGGSAGAGQGALQPLRLIVPDLVGHGRSEAPDDPSCYRVEAMADQVTALADTLGCSTFHLVGYSMGGRVALAVGCTHPRRLRSLALIGATAGIADSRKRRQRADADKAMSERITANFAAFVDEWMALPLFAGQAALGPEHRQAARAQRLESDPSGLAMSLRYGGTGAMQPLHRRLKNCDMPTLLISGSADTKFCAIADRLGANLPDAEVAHIAQAGHAAHVERPDDTAAAVTALISQTERKHAANRTRSA